MENEDLLREYKKKRNEAAKLITFGDKAYRLALEEFLKKHKSAYNSAQIKKIRERFLISYDESMTQIYSALGIMEDGQNPYFRLARLIEKDFGLDLRILEVGGGRYPALAKEIARLQKKTGKGSITVMEPIIMDGIKLDGVTLLKKRFKKSTSLDDFDLVVAKEPCDATEMIINSCTNQNKSLFLSPCDCSHLYEGLGYSIDEWYKHVISLMNKNNGEFIIHEEKIPNYDRPIYSKVLK